MLIIEYFLENPVAMGIVISLLSIMSIILERISIKTYRLKYHEFFSSETLSSSRCCKVDIQGFITKSEILSRVILGLLIIIFLTMLFDNELPLNTTNIPLDTINILVALAIGGTVLPQLVNMFIDFNHLIIYYFVKQKPNILNGKLEVDTLYNYVSSVTTHLSFTFLWFIVFILVGQVFFLGGAVYELHRISSIRRHFN